MNFKQYVTENTMSESQSNIDNAKSKGNAEQIAQIFYDMETLKKGLENLV